MQADSAWTHVGIAAGIVIPFSTAILWTAMKISALEARVKTIFFILSKNGFKEVE